MQYGDIHIRYTYITTGVSYKLRHRYQRNVGTCYSIYSRTSTLIAISEHWKTSFFNPELYNTR